ncbi:MAG: MbcA/ParS/Xre antitoxin family protein [Alphaproteobacteria bacterium]|nr:MbcA/ParS/Xre antitoxin family protein [Alphaproteobacteria bacterium]
MTQVASGNGRSIFDDLSHSDISATDLFAEVSNAFCSDPADQDKKARADADAEDFLTTPNFFLGNQTPAEVARTGTGLKTVWSLLATVCGEENPVKIPDDLKATGQMNSNPVQPVTDVQQYEVPSFPPGQYYAIPTAYSPAVLL